MERIIPEHETIEIEFKSDVKKLSDSDLIDAIVAFANTHGGDLYLGVEDDGTVTGLHEQHQDATQLSAFIANRTVPPISVRIEYLHEERPALVIHVPRSRSIVASSAGKIQRRRLKADGTPENVPMYPHEINSRLSALSLLDFQRSLSQAPNTMIWIHWSGSGFARLSSRITGKAFCWNCQMTNLTRH